MIAQNDEGFRGAISKYLEPTDAGAFRDMSKREPSGEYVVECPKCKGYGGWNLKLDAYGKGKHFQCCCSQCNGWGFVAPGVDATCIHEFEEVGRAQLEEFRKKFPAELQSVKGEFGMCCHNYVCTKCGRFCWHDSSD